MSIYCEQSMQSRTLRVDYVENYDDDNDFKLSKKRHVEKTHIMSFIPNTFY